MAGKLGKGLSALSFLLTHPKRSLLYIHNLINYSDSYEENMSNLRELERQSLAYIRQYVITLSNVHKAEDDHSNLNRCGVFHGTDKANVVIKDSGKYTINHDYLRHYDFILSRFKEEKFTLLEFGCADGNSLRMWKSYFSNAQIVGVDILESAKKLAEKRIDICIGDATARSTCDDIVKKYGDIFVIIDDASHAWSDQRISFETFWPYLESGGFYIVEDLECGAEGAYAPPKILDAQPFYEYAKDRMDILRWAPDRYPAKNRYQFAQLPDFIKEIELSLDMLVSVPGAVIFRKK